MRASAAGPFRRLTKSIDATNASAKPGARITKGPMGCLPYAKNDGHPSCDRPPPPSLGTTGLRIAPTHPIDSSPDCGDESRHPIVSVFTRPVWPCRRNRYRHHEPPARATRQHAARCKRHAKAARQVARRRTAGRAAQARPRRCAPGARHSPAGHGRPGCRRPPPARTRPASADAVRRALLTAFWGATVHRRTMPSSSS